MRIRPLRGSDIPILERMHADSGFAYTMPDQRLIEAAFVVADENDEPVQVAIAERTVQLYLLGKSGGHPMAKMRGIQQLHEALREKLKPLGYKFADAWLPPQIERSFGKRLIRSFGWLRNTWISYSVKI